MRYPSIGVSFLCSVLLYPCLSFSQSSLEVDKATKETDALKSKEKITDSLPNTGSRATVTEQQALQTQEGKSFFIKRVDLSGGKTIPAQELEPLLKKLENSYVTLGDLNDLCREIEQEYLIRGVIAAAIVPPQDLTSQVATIRVIETILGKLTINKARYFNSQRLRRYWSTRTGQAIKYDNISSDIQRMNKNPDRDVRASLQAGAIPGTTDVLLTPQTRFPLHFTSSFDNEGTVTTGKSRQSYGIKHNNFLGLDDSFISSYFFGNAFRGEYAYHYLPVSTKGTYLLYGYSSSSSNPRKEFASYGIKSKADNFTVSLYQDFYRKGKYSGEAFLGLDAKDKLTRVNTAATNRDRLRILRFGGSYTGRANNYSSISSIEISQGLHAFGASGDNNPLASRDAKSDFTKVVLEAKLAGNAAADLRFNVISKAQFSSTKLAPQEEFSLGGLDSVRGYPSGDFLADNAFILNNELIAPALFVPKRWKLPAGKGFLKDQLRALIFLDYGWGCRYGADAGEKRAVNLFSIGPGLRFRYNDNLSFRLEWGFPLGANRSITESGGSRFHFSADCTF